LRVDVLHNRPNLTTCDRPHSRPQAGDKVGEIDVSARFVGPVRAHGKAR
jgi:hypothetical protein